MSLKKRYLIMKVEKIYNDVEMRLHEWPEITIPTLSSEEQFEKEIEEPHIEMQPMPKSDEEKMVMNVMAALKKYAPSVAQTLEVKSMSSSSVGPSLKSLVDIAIILPLEDYRELGKPGVDEVIEVDLSSALKKS